MSFSRRTTGAALLLLISSLLLFGSVWETSDVGGTEENRELSTAADTEKSSGPEANDLGFMNRKSRHWNLPKWGSEAWCDPPQLHPFNFEYCNTELPVNIIPMIGGLTNALKIIVLGAMKSMEDGRCFTIDETTGHLFRRENPDHQMKSFLQRYFEPMGLPYNHPIVKKAFHLNNTHRFDVVKELLTVEHVRKIHDHNYSIPYIWSTPLNGHVLKKVLIHRLWRPLDKVRIDTCAALEKQGLKDNYIAFSIRRGDKKTVEHFDFTNLEPYVEQAEKEVDKFFNGTQPRIFVATDDCSVMKELITMRPTWIFISECDPLNSYGFVLQETTKWTPSQTDQHFQKFFKELFGLALSQIFIGVGYTNVVSVILMKDCLFCSCVAFF